MKLLQNHEQIKFNAQERAELKDVVKQKMEQEKIVFFSITYIILTILASLVAIGTAIGLIFLDVNNTLQIVLIVFLVIALFVLAFLGNKYLSVKAANGKLLNKFKAIRDQSFLDWFNKYYEDIEISFPLTAQKVRNDYMYQVANLRIDQDFATQVSQIYPGYRFLTKKGIIIDAFIAKIWVPLAPIPAIHGSIGMFQQTSQRIEVPHFFAFIENNDQKWDNFKFKIDYSKVNDKSLENSAFNKHLGYESNDPIRLRMLLTPWTQEQLVKNPNFKWTLTRDEQNFLWYGKYLASNNIFDFDRQIKPTKSQMIKIIVDDIIADIEITQSLLQHLSIYKSLIF